jgi:hypothetical protein
MAGSPRIIARPTHPTPAACRRARVGQGLAFGGAEEAPSLTSRDTLSALIDPDRFRESYLSTDFSQRFILRKPEARLTRNWTEKQTEIEVGMVHVAVVMLVGPGQKEIDRTADTLDSIWAYEPHVAWCVLIDDSLHDRDLARRFSIPPTTNAVSIMNPRYGRGIGILGGGCTGSLSALSWIHKHTSASFSLKLDTDALVIAPFVEKIQRAFDAMPVVGMLGSYDIACDGSKRDFSGWGREVRKWSAPLMFRGTRRNSVGICNLIFGGDRLSSEVTFRQRSRRLRGFLGDDQSHGRQRVL